MQNAQVFQKGKNLNPVEKMQFKRICDNFYDDNILFNFYENLRYQCVHSINKKKYGHTDSFVKTNTNLELIN